MPHGFSPGILRPSHHVAHCRGRSAPGPGGRAQTDGRKGGACVSRRRAGRAERRRDQHLGQNKALFVDGPGRTDLVVPVVRHSLPSLMSGTRHQARAHLRKACNRSRRQADDCTGTRTSHIQSEDAVITHSQQTCRHTRHGPHRIGPSRRRISLHLQQSCPVPRSQSATGGPPPQARQPACHVRIRRRTRSTGGLQLAPKPFGSNATVSREGGARDRPGPPFHEPLYLLQRDGADGPQHSRN